MRQVSSSLRAAIDAGERIIDSTFTVDWDNDGVQDIDDLSRKVDSLTMTQSLESSLPQQVQVVPGVAVAQLTATIARGNTFRYAVPAFYRSLTSSSVGSGSTPTWGVAKPTTAKVGDIVLITIFVSSAFLGSTVAGWQVLSKANTSFVPMSVRGDGTTGSTRLEALLLYRRVAADDPIAYTITLPTGSAVAYLSTAVNIGDQNIMGVTDFSQKGEDYTDIPSSILLPQVRVDVPNSTIVSFFGAASYQVSGLSFTPTDVNDTERTELTVVATGKPSIRVSVNTQENAIQGLYQKGVLIGGSPTMSIATIGFCVVLAPKLAGDEAQHAAWTFSELNPNSPYAGKTRIRRRTQWWLRFITNNGFESVPIFTGYTTAPSATSRVAKITALDNRETMRNTSQGLNIVAEYPVSQDIFSGLTLPTLPGLESTWIVSRAFFFAFQRQSFSTLGIFTYDSQQTVVSRLGYFPSPLASRYASVWATMHGSAHAMQNTEFALMFAYTETGLTGQRRRIAFEVGPFVAATRNEGVGVTTYIGYLLGLGGYTPWNVSTGQIAGRLQCWVRRNLATSTLKVNLPDSNGNIYDAWIEVTAAGVVRFRVELPAVSRTITGPTVSADGAWHFLGVHFDSVAGSVTFRLDSVNTVVTMTTWANSSPTFPAQVCNVTLVDGMQICEFQLAGDVIPLTETWANESFTPTAFVDKSENLLDVMPYIAVEDDTFAVVAAAAGAEFAAFFFDADGYPHYRTSRSDANTTGQTIQRQITARRSIKDIAYESGVLQIRNMISVAYQPFAASVNKEIFSASGVITLASNGGSITFKIVMQGPVLGINTITYTAYTQIGGGGSNISSQVTVSANIDEAFQVTITATNHSNTSAFLVDNTGQPNLHVNATFVTPLTDTSGSTVTYVDSDSIREFGEQRLSASGSTPWIQREDSAASIALKLLSDLCQPHPVITKLPIKGDPTLEFGDLVTVIDSNGIGVNGQYRITGKDPSLSPSDGFIQDLVVRSAPAIAYWDLNFWDDGTVWG